jgi:hypothetical protein
MSNPTDELVQAAEDLIRFLTLHLNHYTAKDIEADSKLGRAITAVKAVKEQEK